MVNRMVVGAMPISPKVGSVEPEFSASPSNVVDEQAGRHPVFPLLRGRKTLASVDSDPSSSERNKQTSENGITNVVLGSPMCAAQWDGLDVGADATSIVRLAT